MEEAVIHSGACHDLVDREGLAAALAYCKRQGIEPPQCSLASKSPHEVAAQATAAALVSDYGWWVKRLKLKAARDVEALRIRNGLKEMAKTGFSPMPKK